MTTRIRPRQAIVGACLALLLAACSAGATPAPSAGRGVANPAPTSAVASTAPTTAAANPGASTATVDACLLISQQEATALLGSDPGKGIGSATSDGSSCAYDGSLVVTVAPSPGQAAFDATKASMPGTVQTLDGVGDAAFATIVANTVADMQILKGPVLISVMVQGDPSKQNITADALTGVGKIAVSRL